MDTADDIRELRTLARSAWTALTMLFGRPDALIRAGFISLPHHRQLAGWVRNLEHLVRRILMALALRLFVPDPKPSARSAKTGHPPRFSRPPALKVLAPDVPARRKVKGSYVRKHVRCAADTPVRSAALARRFEALRHALANIDSTAMRLARTIRNRVRQPLPRGLVRLKPWRVPKWRETLASKTFAGYLERIEKHLPDVFVEPG